ncbi:MAG: oligosaccharide flippase family protein [Candidatus Pacebacteria bacterium]|jgi:O-antigen/teichoic acid export membrane protein|nr:oligosaccharide flippase family protein [Candidatus Paceibacterota bacterium]MBT6756022.1 oligosaccharide flippase family protein [Candidatus Paceibacterota bacterium]MBT6920790.1 oligosaccharide flippase family protein [Candidatus Paceibacterota bacterium]
MINSTAVDTTDELEELMDDDISEIKEKSVSGVVSYFLRTAFMQGIGLVAIIILSAFLSPSDFGIYGFVTQIIGLLIFFSDVGLAAALVQQKKNPDNEEYKVIFTLQWILSLLIVGVILLLIWTGFIQQKVGIAGVWVLLSLAVSFPLATLKTVSSIKLERKLLFQKLVVPQIFEQIIFYSLLIALAWKGMGVLSYAYAIIARSIVGVIVMWIIEPWKKIGFLWNTKILKSLLNFGLKFQFNDFLARIKDQLFYLILGIFLPLDQFGYIQWAKNWSMYPYNLTVQNVMAITFPTYSRLQHRLDILKRAIEKSLFFISLAIFPILVGMSIFIWPLTQVFEKYNKWEPAIFSFIFFALSIGWAAISTPLVNTLNAIGHINQTLKLMGMWTVLTWVLTPVFIWKFGFNGVALSAFIISFTSLLSIRMVKKHIPVVIIPQIKSALLAAILMAIVGYLGINYWARDIYRLLLGVVITSGVYGLSITLLDGKKIFVEIKSLINRPKKK